VNKKQLSEIAAELGRKGGKAKSEAKTTAALANGKLGGRPRKNLNEDEADFADYIADLAASPIIMPGEERIGLRDQLKVATFYLSNIVDACNNVLVRHGRPIVLNIHEVDY
jgi:hypothetical protein